MFVVWLQALLMHSEICPLVFLTTPIYIYIHIYIYVHTHMPIAQNAPKHSALSPLSPKPQISNDMPSERERRNLYKLYTP